MTATTANPPKTALIVDDEADIRELLEITLAKMNIRTSAAATVAEAAALLGDQKFDLCLTDMRLPDGTGLDLLRQIERDCPEMPVAVITAYGNVQAAIDSLKAGAFDFVSKPVDLKVLRGLVSTALKLSSATSVTDGSTRLTGNSAPLQALRTRMGKVARSQAPILVRGESGSGKELVARIIHESGPRASARFVPVNCGAIPSELMESEFFGHVRGSFTGADRDKDGLFQVANGGTLFLDEIAELPVRMQVKLLRAIQERAVRPVGGDQEIPADVRIISATNSDLKSMVASGHFRQDLFYRLNVIELIVPPLRERRDDIPDIAANIVAEIAERHGLETAPEIAPQALELLKQADYPGNVRELENVLERAITLSDGQVLDESDFEFSGPAGSGKVPDTDADSNAQERTATDPATDSPALPLERQIEEVEKAAIEAALKASRYNKTRAAERLGISFRALRYRLKKLGID